MTVLPAFKPQIIPSERKRRPRKPSLALVEAGGIPLLELGAAHCRFPVFSDEAIPGRHLFCARPRRPGSSYCPAHRAACVDGGYQCR